MIPIPNLNEVLAGGLRLALQPLRLVPEPVRGEVVARAFNHLLSRQPRSERLRELDGTRVCLRVTDLELDLHLQVAGGALRRDPGRSSQVRVAGSLADFWALATRKEDPDTLFFQRRLELEGDTERGLLIKNSLDALELDLERHVAGTVGPRVARELFRLIDRTVVLLTPTR